MFPSTYRTVKRRHIPGVQIVVGQIRRVVAGDIDAGRGVNLTLRVARG